MTVGDIKLRKRLPKKEPYSYLVIFSHFRSLSIRKSAYVNACFFGTDNQSLRYSQSRLKMITLFCGRCVKGTPIWLLHTGPYKFVHNISTDNWNYKKRTDFKLGEVSCLLISYNITISWLYLPNGYQIIFFIAWQCKPRIFGVPSQSPITSINLKCSNEIVDFNV